jgi:16S rRNA (uracil1498-N3)-methyltransferase
MTLPRFYAPDLDPSSGSVELPADESHHLVRVLRLTAGDQVVVFDGRGGEYLSRVSRADRHRASVTLLEPLPPAPRPPVRIGLVQALLKGDKMDDVVRDATMAGAARITPIVTERSLARISALARSHAQERWWRVAVSSAKQCGRSHLPVLDAPLTFGQWLETPRDGLRLLLVEPSTGDRSATRLRDVLDGVRPTEVSCIVGPEGGWSAAERDLALKAGCTAVSLGSMTLRADAAGLVVVSLVSFALDTRS